MLAPISKLLRLAELDSVEGVTFEWSEEANKEIIRMLLELGNDPNAYGEIVSVMTTPRHL